MYTVNPLFNSVVTVYDDSYLPSFQYNLQSCFLHDDILYIYISIYIYIFIFTVYECMCVLHMFKHDLTF